MQLLELTEIVACKERTKVEFKAEHRLDVGDSAFKEKRRSDLAWDVAAIANTRGGVGYLVIGVDETTLRPSRVGGAGISADQIHQIIGAHCDPPVVVDVEEVDWGGTAIRVIVVPRSTRKPHVVAHRGTPIRRGATTDHASRQEIVEMVQDAGVVDLSERLIPVAWRDVLDPGDVSAYLALQGVAVEPAELADSHVIAHGLVRHEDGQARPTVAATLLFAADPQRFLPQANVTLVRSGEGADPLDTAVASGTFLEQLRLVEEFFLRNLAAGYPMPVVREAVVNALVHRDYADYTGDVVVRLADDRAEVSSPGLLVGALDVATLEGDAPLTPERRNPTLVDLFFRQTRRIEGGSYIERLGSGIRRMQERLAAHGLPTPAFVEDVAGRRFVVRLHGLRLVRPRDAVAERTTQNRRQAEFARLAPAGTRVTAQDYARQFNVSRGTALSDLNGLATRRIVVRRGSGPAIYFEVLDPAP